MQIKLTEVDIREGIALYLQSRGITGVNGAELQVTFTNGRKGSGLTAEVVTNPVAGSNNVAVELKDDNGTTRVRAEKSKDALPAALGGTAGESSNVAGADAAAQELEAKREAADAAPEAKADPVPEAKEEVAPEGAEEGKSLFS